MDEEWVKLIGAALGGGGLGMFFNFLISNKKEDRADFEHIIKVWEEDNQRLRDENDKLRVRIKGLEDDNIKLHLKVVELERKVDVLISKSK